MAFSLQQRALRLTVTSSLNGAQFTLPTSLRQPTSDWCFTRTTRLTLTSSMAQLPTVALMKPAACKQARAGPATTFSCGTATLTNGLQVTYTCAGGGGRRRQRQRQLVHLSGCCCNRKHRPRTIRRRLIGSSAAVSRKPVQRLRHVRSSVMGFRAITMNTCLPIQLGAHSVRARSIRTRRARAPTSSSPVLILGALIQPTSAPTGSETVGLQPES